MPQNENWEKFIFHAPHLFGVALSGIFRRRAALSGATFAEFCSAAQRGAARHGAVSGGAVVHKIVSIKKK